MQASDDPRRLVYLERFADREGQAFLRRFYAKYRQKSPQEALTLLTQSGWAQPPRLATIYRSVYPDHDLAAFSLLERAQEDYARDASPQSSPNLVETSTVWPDSDAGRGLELRSTRLAGPAG